MYTHTCQMTVVMTALCNVYSQPAFLKAEQFFSFHLLVNHPSDFTVCFKWSIKYILRVFDQSYLVLLVIAHIRFSMFTDTGKTPNALLENRPPTPKDVEGLLSSHTRSNICTLSSYSLHTHHCPLFSSLSLPLPLSPHLSSLFLPLSPHPSPSFSHSRGCREGCMWSSKHGKHLLHECWSTMHQKPPWDCSILPEYETVWCHVNLSIQFLSYYQNWFSSVCPWKKLNIVFWSHYHASTELQSSHILHHVYTNVDMSLLHKWAPPIDT